MSHRERQKAQSIRHVFQKFVKRDQKVADPERGKISRLAREEDRAMSLPREKERAREREAQRRRNKSSSDAAEFKHCQFFACQVMLKWSIPVSLLSRSLLNSELRHCGVYMYVLARFEERESFDYPSPRK